MLKTFNCQVSYILWIILTDFALNDPRLKARGSLERLKVAHQLKQVIVSNYSSSMVKLSAGGFSLWCSM